MPYLGYVITWEGIKNNINKLERIMDIGRPKTMNEIWALICMVQYYMYIWSNILHVMATLTEVARAPKDRKILCHDDLEVAFVYIKWIFSVETLIKYLYWSVLFKLHTIAPDKQLGAVISQNNKLV